MKSFYTLSIVISLTSSMVSLPLWATHEVTEELEYAIKESDILKVEKLLSKVDTTLMTTQEKKSVFAHLIGIADDILASEESVKGLLANRWDIIRFVGGALVGVYAASRLVKNWYSLSKEACRYCNCIECGNKCRCSKCNVRSGVGICYCADAYYVKTKDSSTKFMHGLKGAPYIGLALAGFYQMYQGLRGASHEATIASIRRIKALLHEKVSE